MAKHYSYFPGCTLATTARSYDQSGRAIAEALGIELAELPDWNCCGATFPLSVENIMDMIGPARMLIASEAQQGDLAALCAVCYNVLKRTDHFLKTHSEATERLNLFVEEGQYTGQARVRHLLGILRDDVGWEAIAARTTMPLKGLRAAPYYGCMLLRPQPEIGLDDQEAPTVLHDLLSALGATPVSMSHATECCGSYLLVSKPHAIERLSEKIVGSARRAGANLIVTACPLCQHNLTQSQAHAAKAARLPVVYFTEVMAAAFGMLDHAGEVRLPEVTKA